MEGFHSVSGEAFLRTFVVGLLRTLVTGLVCSVGKAGQRGAGPPWLSARVTSPDGSPEQPGSHQGSAVLKPSLESSTCTDSSSGLGRSS